MRLLPLFCLAFALSAADYDLLIRSARVADRTGNPWFHADVGVRDGRIAAVGDLSHDSAKRIVDAKQRTLAPGFIDVHTHVEGSVEKVPGGDNYLMDGVTTVVTGNCGGSEADLGAWFSQLEKIRIGLNLASLIGHNTVRTKVMGTAKRLATAGEIVQMQALVEQNMRAGAVGFSTGLIYIRGTYSSSDEVVALAKAASKYGGVYSSHMRDEGDHVLDAIDEAIRVGREGGMRVELSHFKIDNQRLWGTSQKSIDLVEKPAGRESTSWWIAKEIEVNLKKLGHKDYSYAVVAACSSDRSTEGKSISEINRMRGGKKKVAGEIQTILDLETAGGAQMVYHSMGDKDVDRIMRYTNTGIASDGGIREFGVGVPHPRSYGTNARVLAEYVRQRNILTLEDAIRKMTSLPRTLGFRDRGQIREGYWADLVLFDPARVQDKATYTQPHQFSEGFDMVMVNGQPVVEEGKLTAARPGQIVRHLSQ